MLVLHREFGQEIYIGENIRLIVKPSTSGACKIILDAPRDIPILRREVAERTGQVPKRFKSKSIQRKGVKCSLKLV